MPSKKKRPFWAKLQTRIKKQLKRTKKQISTKKFAKRYAVGCLLILLSTTVFWSILGARVQESNADQLINPYLMDNGSTFRQAILSGAHSFLIKWPIFLLIKLFNYSGGSFIFFTVACSLITVAALAYILYRIERRPMVFGTLWLALASTLLLVPTQPYGGGLLPVNMAMITTRNIEYVVFIGALALMVKASRLRSWGFWAGVVLLGLAVASDKLFLTLGVGGALLALIFHALMNHSRLVSFSVRWLIGTVSGSAIALAVLWLINAHKVVHLSSGSSPYSLVHNIHDIVLGIVYVVAGIFTNLGANPAFSAVVVKDIPHKFLSGLLTYSGPAYLVNLLILIGGLYMLFKLMWPLAKKSDGHDSETSKSNRLFLVLFWSSAAAVLAFIFTGHYYAVDARYLTIALFALFIGSACFMRGINLNREKVLLFGVVILAGIIFGLPTAFNNYQNDQRALADINNRNNLVIQALANHKVDSLFADYWRAVPIKFNSQTGTNIVPLDSCTNPRSVLSTQAWQANATKHSFAYLLSLDKGLTDYPGCSLDQVVQAYGRPNSSLVIDGTQTNPKELLLFYDQGADKYPLSSPLAANGVLPIALDQVPYTSCPNGTNIMNIVAHEDDDLLFINPDTINALQAGHCIRTIYVTAGDAGSAKFYWLSREQGSEAAYSTMLNSNAPWVNRTVQIASTEYVDIAHPKGDSRVSLIFMHLPDGNLNGAGFKSSLYQSLAKLESGKINSIYSVDNQSVYTFDQLVSAVVSLIHIYQPVEIRTQANYISQQHPDHSDHMAVGRLVKQAYGAYDSQEFEGSQQIPLKFYIGYPIHGMPANISGPELSSKESVWFAYAEHDPAVCHSQNQCNQDPAYGFYLTREYQNSN